MADIPELVFVYNADATLAAAASDFATRLFAPEKYACNLCMVTYGPLTMKSPWKEFLETFPHKKTFLHRDEFKERYPARTDTPLPVIFAVSGENFDVVLNAEEINRAKNWQELKEALLVKLHG